MVTIVGPGGCGKTRLALELTQKGLVGFGHIWFIDLASLDNAARFASHTLHTLGIRDQLSASSEDLIADFVGDNSTLFLFDNCEHVVSAAASFVANLLDRIPAMSVLATSRRPLRISGEKIVRLGPLSNDISHGSTSDAHDLFLDRLRLVSPAFDPEKERSTIDEICHALEGMPLSLELAAGRAHVMSLVEIRDATRSDRKLLRSTTRDVGARHLSVDASVEWSYELLDDDSKSVLRSLALFVGPFSRRAARELLNQEHLVDCLDRLIEDSLVVFSERSLHGVHEFGHLRLLDSVRMFALDRLACAPDGVLAEERHIARVVQLCRSSAEALENRSHDEFVRRLNDEYANLVANFDRAIRRGDVTSASAMQRSLTHFWTASGRFTEADRWYVTLSKVDIGFTSPVDAEGHWSAAHVALYGGNLRHAHVLATKALALAEVEGSLRAKGRALDVLAFLASYQNPHTASDLYREAIQCASLSGDCWCEADASQLLAYHLIRRRQMTEAVRWLDHARPIVRRLGNPQLIAWDHAGVGQVLTEQGQLASALKEFDLARDAGEVSSDPNVLGCITAWRSTVKVLGGDIAVVVEELTAALDQCQRAGAGQAVLALASAALFACRSMGEDERAEGIYAEFGPSLEADFPDGASVDLRTAATSALVTGRVELARTRLLRAVELARSANNDLSEARANVWLGAIELLDGDTKKAERRVFGTVHAIRKSGGTNAQVELGLVLSCISHARGDLISSERLSQAAFRVAAGSDSTTADYSLDQPTGVNEDRSIHVLATILGIENKRHQPSQIHMTLDDAIDMSLRGKGPRTVPHMDGWA